MTDFDGVRPSLAQALDKRGYTELTPVQTAVLTPEMQDADALVSAQTGSGKTVAFGLAIAPTLLGDADRFERADVPLGLVIAPTRELALQVKTELEWLYAEAGATVTSCVGGMDMRTERRVLDRGAHIVVGTPGRLRDHIERGSFDTSKLKAVILDEADEMLDMGFRDDLEYILDTSPESRRTLLFSATVARPIANLAKKYQRDAIRISTASEQKQHADIDYQALTVAPNDRENAIINVLRYHDAKNAIVFCGTRATVNHLTSRFNNRGFSVVALSGELSQNERSHALQALRDGRAKVCIATDVAARGIDLPDLGLVIHADLPRGPEPLLHRSGRTGRAGRKGVSTLIVPHNWRKRTERLLSSAKVKATWGKPPSIEDITRRDRERFLADPAFNDPIQDDEQAFIKDLLEKHSPEQVAAALVRLHNAAKPAAEELLDAGPAPREREKGPRVDFPNGVWVSVSVGRKHTAEPRWLIPMLCRAGHITNKEIGAIRIQQEESFIELEPGCIDKFLEAVGPSGMLEKTVEVKRVDGPPKDTREHRGKKPYRDEKPGGYPKRKFEGKNKRFDKEDKAGGKFDRKPRSFEDDKTPEGRPEGRPDRKPKFAAPEDKPKDRYKKREGNADRSDKVKRSFDRKPREFEEDKAPRGRSERSERSEQPEQKTESAPAKPRKQLKAKTSDGKPYGKFNGKPKDKKTRDKKDFSTRPPADNSGGSGFLKRKKPKKLL